MPPIICQLPVDVVECPIRWRERMSSFPSGPGQPSYYSQHLPHNQSTWSLNDLSTELLALIFQQVRANLLAPVCVPGLAPHTTPVGPLCRWLAWIELTGAAATGYRCSVHRHCSTALQTVQPDSDSHCVQDTRPKRAYSGSPS